MSKLVIHPLNSPFPSSPLDNNPPCLQEVEYVAQTCDGDAYNCSGQKCSAQSILFMHENWEKESNLLKRMEELAARRNIQDLTIGPVLTW